MPAIILLTFIYLFFKSLCNKAVTNFLIEKHFHTPFAEIDLFMKHPSGFFIIEVKSVSSFEMLERVKYSQQFERLKRAHLYLSTRYENVYALLAVVESFKNLYIFEDFL